MRAVRKNSITMSSITHEGENADPVVEIRKIERCNIRDFLGLIEQLAQFEKLDPPDEEARERLESDALSDHPPYEAFLAYLDDKPVGYITYFFTYSTFLGKPTLFLEDIFVQEEVRRKGIGKELFKHCLKEAMRRGCGRLEWTVLTWNRDAIDFYEQLGGKRLDWYFYRIREEEFEDAMNR